MDLLLSEISNKRKDLSSTPTQQQGNGTSKYMRRGDLERAKLEEERRKKEEDDKRKREEREKKEKEKVSPSRMRASSGRMPVRLKCQRGRLSGSCRRIQSLFASLVLTQGSLCSPTLITLSPPLVVYSFPFLAQMDRLALLRRDRASSSRSPEPSTSNSRGDTPGVGVDTTGNSAAETFNISSTECIRRLRSKGEPILLFGESEKERRLRLRALELLEERQGGAGGGGQGLNDWKRAMEIMERDGFAKEVEQRRRNKDGQQQQGSSDIKGKGKEAALNKDGDDQGVESAAAAGASTPTTTAITTTAAIDDPYAAKDQVLDMSLVKTDPKKVYPLIYYALKGLLKEWGEALEQRPGEFLCALRVASCLLLASCRFSQIRSQRGLAAGFGAFGQWMQFLFVTRWSTPRLFPGWSSGRTWLWRNTLIGANVRIDYPDSVLDSQVTSSTRDGIC